jgi:hypothetical protein
MAANATSMTKICGMHSRRAVSKLRTPLHPKFLADVKLVRFRPFCADYTAQACVVALLDGRIEGVHVDMDDAPNDRRLIGRRYASVEVSTKPVVQERNVPAYAGVGLSPLQTWYWPMIPKGIG